jgi:branched-chain amino acid transport system ATP-binding protein
MPLLEVEAVETGYGATQVLRGLSIRLGEEERIGLFGPNGHGKTTLLKTISGLLPAWKGSIRLGGREIAGDSPRSIVDRGVVHVPQGNTLFPELTVLENLRLGSYIARARANAAANLERVYAMFPRLAERRGQQCKTLSGGERQMVSIGAGLMAEPRILMLDEPTLGLAPRLKDELCAAIGRISETGVQLVVVEQDVEFLLTLTDRLYMVSHGEVVLETTAQGGIDHDEIMRMYFGKEA